MFWRRAGRERKIPRAPEGVRLYAVGDVHGCAHLLASLCEAIRADLEGWAGETRTIFLGDYIDRGPDSAGVVDILAGTDLPNPVFLKGNHEDMLLTFLAGAEAGPLWLRNGAAATLASYGIDVDRILLTHGYGALREAFAVALPEAHRTFFSGLRLSHREGDFFFCHAGVRPGVALDAQVPDDLIWIRDEFLLSPRDHGAVIVHGHTPSSAPEILPNRINIDTGAFLTHVLTCLVIEGAALRLIQATPSGVAGHEIAG